MKTAFRKFDIDGDGHIFLEQSLDRLCFVSEIEVDAVLLWEMLMHLVVLTTKNLQS